jgi:hypothetical protein
MQNQHATTLLDELIRQAESHLQLAIHDWQVIPHAQFAQPPAPKAWSANQCLQHLNQYGDHYLPAITRVLAAAREPAAPLASPYQSGWLGGYFIKMMKTQPNGQPAKKMKAMKGYQQYAIRPSHEVVAEFIDQQETLIALMERARKYPIDRLRVPTSISPWIRLKLGDTFQFIVAHNHRHVQQALRALGKGSKVQTVQKFKVDMFQ